ncbi:hypothetical protein OEZ86_006803 [Tetradesmus obliquus]|nr:hypothetical protein OEZ86_006803 [Tetradesmus obliquus]
MGHATRALRSRIEALPRLAVEYASCALNELPRGWEKGIKKPAQHLEVVVGRAAAHAAADGAAGSGAAAGSGSAAAAAAAGADGEEGWVTLGEAGSSSSSSSSSSPAVEAGGYMAAAAAAAGGSSKPSSVQAAWAKLEKERPDVACHLADRHRALIKPLMAQQQLQLLQLLYDTGRSAIASAADKQGLLFKFIANAAHMMTTPMPKELQAAFKQLQARHPQVMQYLDHGTYARISALPLNKALLAVQTLMDTEYGPQWEAHTHNHAAWLMKRVSRALNEATS